MQMWFKRLNIFSDFIKSRIQCLSSILQRGVRPSSGESEENLVLRHLSDGAVYMWYIIHKQRCRVCWCFHFTFLPFYFILSRIQKMKTSITTLRKGLWMKVMLSLSSRAPCRLEGAPVAFRLFLCRVLMKTLRRCCAEHHQHLRTSPLPLLYML